MEAAANHDVLVIGYGNELRGDDGLGPYIAGRIELRKIPGVRVLRLHQLTPELSADLAAAQAAIFIDAQSHDRGEGSVVRSIEPAAQEMLMTHSFNPQSALAISQILYGRAPPAWMATVTGDDFEPGHALSRAALSRADTMVRRIERLIQTVLSHAQPCHEEQQ